MPEDPEHPPDPGGAEVHPAAVVADDPVGRPERVEGPDPCARAKALIDGGDGLAIVETTTEDLDEARTAGEIQGDESTHGG